jgi:hypothetical protein
VPDQLGREKGAIVEWPSSNRLRAASLDNTERRLDGPKRYVVGHGRLAEALEGERAKLFLLNDPVRPFEHIWRDRDANRARRL